MIDAVQLLKDSSLKLCSVQSQKTQGFCVADFPTLYNERRSRSEIVLLFYTDKGTLRSKI